MGHKTSTTAGFLYSSIVVAGTAVGLLILSVSAYAFDPTLIYDDALQPGWGSLSNDVAANPSEVGTVYTGLRSYKVIFPNGIWGSFVLSSGTGVVPNNRKVLSFAVSGGALALSGSTMWVRIGGRVQGESQDSWLDPKQLSAYLADVTAIPSNTWRRFDIPLTDLYRRGSQTPNLQRITAFAFQNNTGSVLYTDLIRFAGFHFPLMGAASTDKAIRGLTAFNTRVTAVLDNDFSSNNSIKSYNGQIGSGRDICFPPDKPSSCVYGYLRDIGGPFNLPLINYDDEVAPPYPANNYLFYDGPKGAHTGYDYAPSNIGTLAGTPIYAAEAGKLCLATANTNGNRNALWRDATACPTKGGPLQWDQYHAFYIIHSDGTSSWYVHAQHPASLGQPDTQGLGKNIYYEILDNGFAAVKRGQHIAYVGGYGGYPPHFHFGYRDAMGTLADPYGNSDTNFSNLKW